MLPKRNRVDKKTVQKIFKDGFSLFSENLSLKFIKSKEKVPIQISFVVPKSISKKAVTRNLLRRRGYSLLSKFFNKIPSNIVGVFIFGKKSLELFGGKRNKKNNAFKNLEKEIETILRKIK